MDRASRYIFHFLIVFYITSCSGHKTSPEAQLTILDIPGYPKVFEMNRGEMTTVRGVAAVDSVETTIRLLDYQLFRENNRWFREPLPESDIYRADVFVEINGEPDTLIRRAYQSPEVIDGFRWYVESIAVWDSTSQVHPVMDLKKEVRISVCPAGKPWGPAGLTYPVRNYRWRSSSYMNTWSSLVPYNLLYYHQGEDEGAVPDILDVVSLFDGKIISSAYPDGDGASNSVVIRNKDGLTVRYAHMNTGMILASSAAGLEVTSGQVLGKTGETWNRRRSQKTDPHVHVELEFNNHSISLFPYLMEAYFRDYPDRILAAGGGYRFGVAGDTIELDGTRTLVAPGNTIKGLTWITHGLDTLDGAKQTIRIDKPGLYSEQLMVRTNTGETDRDFLQVRIFDPSVNARDVVCGFVHYTPVRDILPGDTVLFWNRLWNNTAPVQIDYGDGTRRGIIDKQIRHVYATAGRYVVTFSTSGINGEPATVQVEVIVD